MNTFEKQMLQILLKLKENHNAIGVKVEFEAEGASFDDAFRLKEIADAAGVDLTVKIGGCEAIRDIREAKKLDTKAIVAPMVESVYAFKKYINAIKTCFTLEERQNKDFFINIETIDGFKNLNEMLKSEGAEILSGIVFGRNDMCGSLGLSLQEVNSDIIFDYGRQISKKVFSCQKELIVGGRVTDLSISFMNQLPFVSKFETRKIIFDAPIYLQSQNTKNGFKEAFEFEILWIKNKMNYNGSLDKQDLKRIEILEKYLY